MGMSMRQQYAGRWEPVSTVARKSRGVRRWHQESVWNVSGWGFWWIRDDLNEQNRRTSYPTNLRDWQQRRWGTYAGSGRSPDNGLKRGESDFRH